MGDTNGSITCPLMETIHQRPPHMKKEKNNASCKWQSLLLLLLLPFITFMLPLVVLHVLRSCSSTAVIHQSDRVAGDNMKDGVAQPDVERNKNPEWRLSLLTKLHTHYQRNPASLVVFRHSHYEVISDKQQWHFVSLQQAEGLVGNVSIFQHSSVERFQLVLESPDGGIMVYNITTEPNSVDYSSDQRQQSSSTDTLNTDSTSDWVAVDVSDYLSKWMNDGWDFSVVNKISESNLNDTKQQFNQKDQSLFQPIVALSSNSATLSEADYKLRTNFRDQLTRKIKNLMQKKSYTINNNQYIRPNSTKGENASVRRRKRQSIHSDCKVSEMVVSMKDLGMWTVMLPRRVTFRYCTGTCSLLDHSAIFSTNAIIRARYKFMHDEVMVPSPQCSPMKYNYQDFFVLQNKRLKKIRVDDFNAIGCGCR